MLTRVTAQRLHDMERDVHVVGVDLETGEKVKATLGEHMTVFYGIEACGEIRADKSFGARARKGSGCERDGRQLYGD